MRHETTLDELDALRAACARAPQAHGMRGVWVMPMRERLRERGLDPDTFGPAEAPPCQPGALFSFLPIGALTLWMAGVGGALAPDRPLVDASNAFIEDSMELMLQHTMLRPLLVACGGDLGTFLDVSARSHDIFYNHGSADLRRLDDGALCMHYRDHHADLERCFIPGYFRGVARAFGRRGQVRFEQLDAAHFDLIIEPDPT